MMLQDVVKNCWERANPELPQKSTVIQDAFKDGTDWKQWIGCSGKIHEFIHNCEEDNATFLTDLSDALSTHAIAGDSSTSCGSAAQTEAARKLLESVTSLEDEVSAEVEEGILENVLQNMRIHMKELESELQSIKNSYERA